ncbi:MAG: heme ABC exporter ATP-binding protein CcmA [Actinobacteria bacterium]|nr:heme ABC exporter ATP-binding protein CcmA [Actinomycetota bacterium]
MEAAVHLRGAVCLLGGFPALAGVDLAVAPGEVLLLQGPNGAGKTTLLRLCAGLVPLSAGTGRVLGLDLRTEARAVRRRVGLLGHTTGLYEDLTVADNVRFWARAAGAPTEDASAAMARLGLDGRLRDVTVGRLSAGQRRRAAFAVLLARRPHVWLLDEPHAALDQDGRDAVDHLVRQAAASGVTVLLASHELDRAVAIADRVVDVAGGAVSDPEPAPAAPAEPSGTAPGTDPGTDADPAPETAPETARVP